MQTLIVIPFFAEQAARAERLLDCIYWCGGQKQSGHVLLVAAPDVHAEMRTKLTIAAEVGFESVSLFGPKTLMGKSETDKINNLFSQTANHIAKSYRWPWLWLEPHCVPLKPDWREQLAKAYDDQPRAYFGPHIRIKRGAAEQVFLSRTAIYPVRAVIDLEKHCTTNMPFEQASAVDVVPKSTKNRLIQRMDFNGLADLDKIRPDAVLLDNDRTGELVEKLIEETPHIATTGHSNLIIKHSSFPAWQSDKFIEVPPRKRGWPKGKPRKVV